MRESLTIFAGLVILILTVALVGPYFVDWTAQRGWVEKLLSDAIGAPVEVAGAIDVKLLPTPSLSLEKVVMGGTAPGDASFKANRLELQMAVTPLLRGEVQFIQANFEAPEVHLTVGADGGIVLPHAPAALPAAMQFSAISLRHGRLFFDDQSNKRSFSVDAVNLDAQADSLVGPFKGSGNFARAGGGAIAFDFGTAALQDGALTLKASFEPTSTTPAATVAGAIGFSRAAAGATRISFNGTAAVSGIVAVPGGSSLPWHIASPVTADPHHASFTALDLRIGDEDHALAATGTAEVDWSGTPRAQTSLSAQQIDLDALLAPKDGARFDSGPLVQAFSRILADPGSTRRVPIPLTVSFDAPALILGGETLTQIAGKLDVRSGAPIGIALKADGPGRSHLDLVGSAETGSAAGYDGHAEAGFADKTRLADWLSSAFPEIAGRLRALPARRVELSGDIDVSASGFSGRDLRIRADQSKFGGTLAFTKALGGARARLFADLSADALDLDALPDLSGPTGALGDADLELKFDARAVRVARFGQGVVDAGHIHLELTKTDERAVLKNLSIANLGGASVTATGLATPDALRLEANLDADRLGDLAALLRRVAPGPVADMLAARATALSPAHLELTAAATKANGSDQLTGLILTGVARGTRINASANPDPTDPQAISAKVMLDSADTSMLLRQFGVQTVPISAFGRGHVALTLAGRFGGDFDADLAATFADTNVGFQGRLSGGSGNLNGSGGFTVKGANLAPLMQIAAIGLPDATIGLPADLSGKLNFDGTKITISDLAGQLAGTRIKGDITDTFAANPGGAKLTGALALDRLSITALTSLALGVPQPAAKGALWSTRAFGAPFAAAPAADLSLSANELDLMSGVVGHDAKLHLNLAPNLLTLADLSMSVGGGRAGGQVTLRRDGSMALASGNLQVDSLAFRAPYASGQASGTVDFTAAGQNAAAFVASLAGNGSVHLSGLTVERTDPEALARVIAATDQGSVAVDEPEVRSALGLELDKAPLHLDDASYDVGMAAGILRLAAKNGASGSQSSAAGLSAVFDLRQAILDARVTVTSKTMPRDWSGPAPQAAIVWHGPFDAATRSLDSAGFFNALAARALVREAAHADTLEQDIRERAYFSRYLKGLQFMHRRAREIAAFQAQQAEAARRAAEQARQAEAARADTQPSLVPAPAPSPPPSRDPRPAPNVVPAPSLPLPLNLHPAVPPAPAPQL